MYTHAPRGYRSPFLDLIGGLEHENMLSKQSDVFYRDAQLISFISAHKYQDAGGNALVVPNEPYENLYSIPDEVLCAVHGFAKRLAVAFKEVYGCDGVTLRQHNEPAGSQDVWHYHLHVIPRYEDDRFYRTLPQKIATTAAERSPYARRLRNHFQNAAT